MVVSNDWQTWAALGVVAITVVAFVVRSVRKRRAAASGCASAGDCGCSGSKIGAAKLGGSARR
jgi:hypothetical protein